ncbi:hypothetical protein GCM10023087_22010 [Microbacterium rhizosphaerae]
MAERHAKRVVGGDQYSRTMPYEPDVPDGQHLGTSRTVDGAVTGHLFDDKTNDLKGHATWRWVDEPDEDYSGDTTYATEQPRPLTPEERIIAEALAQAILTGIVVAVQVASPHVKRWWTEKFVPGVRSRARRLIAPRKPKRASKRSEQSIDTQRVFVASATGAELVVADPKIKMSRAEWKLRLQAMLDAANFQDEQRRILSVAEVVDDEAELEAVAAEELTPQQFAQQIKRMVEANPALLDSETSAELIRVLAPKS